MKYRKLFIIPLILPLLGGCSNNGEPTEFDPFMIGDNLEVVSTLEAKLIANEAYDNLSRVSTLSKRTTDTQNDTNYYTGAYSKYATNKTTTSEIGVVYYSNKSESTSHTVTTTYLGNDSAIEERDETKTEWYGIKPVKEGETPSTNYALLKKTIDTYNGIPSTRYFSLNDNFSDPTEIVPKWNKYIIDSINVETNISYFNDYTYVRDNQHIVGYKFSSVPTSENSKVAPANEEKKIVKKVDKLDVIDFYKDDLLGIDWTVRTIASRTITSYLSTVDGLESEPIEINRIEEVTTLSYDTSHSASEDIPVFELTDTQPFFVAKFVPNEGGTDIVYDQSFEAENNDDYYRRFEPTYNGHAYYLETKLTQGFYSFYDGTPATAADYEKWGYPVIKSNACPSSIVSFASAPKEEQEIAKKHDATKLFYVNEDAKYSFRILFDSEMKNATEFAVAKTGI